MPSRSLFSRGLAFALLFALSGCPRPPLPPPPKGAGGPATEALAARDAKIGAVRANAVLRTRIPEGRPGAPGGKITSIALAAARPPRARLELLTPLGTPAATVLLADGLFQAYDPFGHVVRKAPMDSPRVTEMLGAIPLPLARVPDLMRGAVPLESGEIRETAVPDAKRLDGGTDPGSTLIDVVRDGRTIQQVRVHAEGGYPLEDIRYDAVTGRIVMATSFADYGGAETNAGPIAFPQKIVTRVYDESGQEAASVEVRLSGIEIDPPLGEDAFRLVFERPPRIEDL